MSKLYIGVAIKNISKINISNIKIPIPSIEKQKITIDYLDFIYEKLNKPNQETIKTLIKANEYCISNQKKFGENIIKTLGEICNFLPKSKRQASYGNSIGLYPFFKSSMKINTFVNEPDYSEESLIIGDGGEPNINYGINFSTSDHCYILQNANTFNISLKFIYYYLLYNLDNMSKLYIGLAIKNISKINIYNIKIPIPSIEQQKKIIKYCDSKDILIKQLENDIFQNKIEIQLFISSILKSHNTNQNNLLN